MQESFTIKKKKIKLWAITLNAKTRCFRNFNVNDYDSSQATDD